jgi:hypothetical protein
VTRYVIDAPTPPRRVVLTDDLDGVDELLDHDCLGFHAVTLRQALVDHADRYCHDRTVVWRQYCFEHRRTTAYPRRPTSNGNSDANSSTLTVPTPCHCGQTRRRLVPFLVQGHTQRKSVISAASLGDLVEASANLLTSMVQAPDAHASAGISG